MKANAEVLLLEDDAEKLEELRRHFASKGFHPLAYRSASRAIGAVRDGEPLQPVVAIVDWDLTMAPDQSATSTDALCVLARELPECLVIVYTANVDSFRVRSEINRAHPRAWLHDKREGDDSLMERLDRMLDHPVADLRVQDGTMVVHLPTQDQYHHREAVRLVIHHPAIVTFHSDTATRAVRRFGVWLERHGSPATVVSHGNRRYRLAVTGAGPATQSGPVGR
jgi:DNA-binding NtrC family response regulator